MRIPKKPFNRRKDAIQFLKSMGYKSFYYHPTGGSVTTSHPTISDGYDIEKTNEGKWKLNHAGNW